VILDRIWTSGPEARLLPAEKLHGPTVSLMAIMTFAMIVVAAAGLALANAAGLVASGAENRYVIELPAAAVADLPQVMTAVRSAPGVSEAKPVPQDEMRRTLEQWLGSAASSPDLPVPALVTLELTPGANLAAIEAKVRQSTPSARLIAETSELKPLLSSVRALQWLALSLVLLMAAATAAAVVLAARGALDTHRSTIEIMHGIGATDAQLARLFQAKIAVDAAAGAIAGAIGAAIVLLMISGGAAAITGELAARSPLTGIDIATLVFLPVAIVVLATLVARWTVFRALRATL
jgi:cell division transport system permease protein